MWRGLLGGLIHRAVHEPLAHPRLPPSRSSTSQLYGSWKFSFLNKYMNRGSTERNDLKHVLHPNKWIACSPLRGRWMSRIIIMHGLIWNGHKTTVR